LIYKFARVASATAVGSLALCLLAARPALAISAACTATNVSSTQDFPATIAAPAGTYEAGETITFTVTPTTQALATATYTFPDATVVPAQTPPTGATRTLAAAATGAASVQVTGIVVGAYTVAITCTGVAGTTGSTLPTAGQQQAQNAQAALTNGRLVLQQVGDAIKRGVIDSFGARASSGVGQLKTPPAEAREAERQNDDTERPRQTAAATENRFAVARLNRDDIDAAFCSTDGDSCDASDPRWNAWAEGRFYGFNDSPQQQSSTAFLGQAGGDYKLTPWLAAGLSVGLESFETRTGFSALRTGTFGVSVMPYLGLRLDPNVFLSAFLGGTRISYNTTPQAGLTGQFESWRVFGGAALAGVWQLDAWRFQPTLSFNYGSEAQNGYTNSVGTLVPGQTVTYGRVAAGPEIGYAFTAPDRSWTVEPFVTARANLDFGNTNALLFNGVQYGTRGSGSGSVGGGVRFQLPGGAHGRAEASYDSIGVSGLDIWSVLLRAGWRF
jgi:hypothetical protein